MHKLEILSQFDSNQLRAFLQFVKYPKFHLFPNVTTDCITNYLFELITNNIKNSTIFSYSINSDIIALAIINPLDWDTKHFGFKCASIDCLFYNQNKDSKLLHQALERIFCEIEKEAILNGIKFMSIDINAIDSLVCSTIQSHNFNYILTWVDGIYDSKKKIELEDGSNEIGLVKESEIEYFKDIASKYYYKAGRFYLDKYFDISSVNAMYSNLINSSFNNNDIMLSYRIRNKPVGLFVCKKIITYNHFNNLRVAPLRFLVVDPEVRQRNIGYELFAGTLNYLLDICDIITTGLEVHNLPSLNLHNKLNFKINYAHNVFHWWSPVISEK